MQTRFQQFVAKHPDRTHEEWAKVLGCSRSHFTMLVNGTAQPGKALMVRIEQASRGFVQVSDWFPPSSQPLEAK
jgi:hypothetical protein